MAKRQPTSRTTLREIARHLIVPADVVTTGWPAVRNKCAEIGVTFDEWQDDAGRAILAKRADGIYACSVGGAVLSIPRQVGKTFLIAALIFALCLLNPETKVLWTAHRLRTANETFAKLQAFANRRKVAPHIKQVYLGSGTGEIVFKNGSRILFGARERGFGRGFDGVDVEVFDEAQILTENAIDDMVPATNTAANPLLFFIGTPPKPDDPSEVFTRKRELALSGEDTDTLYIELSADDGCNPLDRKQWAKANPSFPSRTPEAAMLRMHKNLTLESFIREALGVWDVVDLDNPFATWPSLADMDSMPTPESLRLALDAPPSLTSATFSIAGLRGDGLLHMSVRYHVPPAQMNDLVALAQKLTEGHGTPLIVAANSPAKAFLADLGAAGVNIDKMTAADAAAAFGNMQSKVREGMVRHRNQPELNNAVAGLATRTVGDVDAPTRRKSSENIAPLIAAMCALYRVPEKQFAYNGPLVAVRS